MDAVQQNLADWKESLVQSIPVSGLLNRNPVVYKWRSCFRIWMLREVVAWRLQDLLAQSYQLLGQGHCLGARVLLRSGFESLAVLIYLNQLMQQVLDGKLDFHLFGKKTGALLLGSRDGSTELQSINIMTILTKCEERYPGLMAIYAGLCESAHPNYEGMVAGYSKIDHADYRIDFSNRWMELYGHRHSDSLILCMDTFHIEYNIQWADLMGRLETWIEFNDQILDLTKDL
jgi:hypothetical protein